MTDLQTYSVYLVKTELGGPSLYYIHYAYVGDDLYGFFSYSKSKSIAYSKTCQKNGDVSDAPLRAFELDNNKLDATNSVANILFEEQIADKHYDLFESAYDGAISLVLVYESKAKPLVYVNIPKKMIKYIIKNKIKVYYDYFDNGLCEFEEPIDSDTFIVTSGIAEIYHGEPNVVRLKDYTAYKKSISRSNKKVDD